MPTSEALGEIARVAVEEPDHATGPHQPGLVAVEIHPIDALELGTGAVTLRWGRGPIAVVKRAAAILGVPYQTCLEQVVFRQTLADIDHGETGLGPKLRAAGSGRRAGAAVIALM